jgi:hypothetical protein
MSINIERHNIWQKWVIILSLYPTKKLAIASGATPIRSAERAPDDIYKY